MNPDPSVLDLSANFGTPTRRTVGRRACSTPIATGDSWPNPCDASRDDNTALLDTLDDFLEEYGTFFKSSSSSSIQSLGLVAADGGADNVSDTLDLPRAGDKDTDDCYALLDSALPLVVSSHLEVPEICKIAQASPWIVNRDRDDDRPTSICPFDAPQLLDHPPNSTCADNSNEGAFLYGCQQLLNSAGPQVTQAHEGSPSPRFANEDSDENSLLRETPDLLTVEDSDEDPPVEHPFPRTILTGLEVTQACVSLPLLRLQNEASDEACLLRDSPPLVRPRFLEASGNCENSPTCPKYVNAEDGLSPLPSTSQLYEGQSGLGKVNNEEHAEASLWDGPHFPIASILGVPKACECSENCQDAPGKTETLEGFAARVPRSTGTALDVVELPALSEENDIAADILAAQNLSCRHSPVFFTGISDSFEEKANPTDAVCIDMDSNSNAVVADELTERVTHIKEVDTSPAEDNDNVELLVSDGLGDIGDKTPETTSEVKIKESPACSVKSTDILLIDVDKEDLTIVAEDPPEQDPEQDRTLVVSSPPVEDADPQEGTSATTAFHCTVNRAEDAATPDNKPHFDLRQKINNIRKSSIADAAGCSNAANQAECSSACGIAEAQFSKQQALSAFVISHLHDAPPCSSKPTSLFPRVELEQTSQKPQTSAATASKRAPFMSEDPEENNDNENPEWERLRQLTTDEERYEAVRNVWHNSTIPNPHCELTTFHYRRQMLRVQGADNTRVPKQHKRKASRSSGSNKPAKRQRMDTDVFDLKLKALERKRSHDVHKAQQNLEWNLGQLRSSVDQNQWQGNFQQGNWQHHRNHRRANTAPWDFRYYQQEEQMLHAQFMAEQESIHHKYSAKENKLLSAREEVRRFDKFYVGLQQADPRKLTEEQLKDQLKMEKLLGKFRQWYKDANN
ncbi:unnamed protein product [Ixodes hexagonus]